MTIDGNHRQRLCSCQPPPDVVPRIEIMQNFNDLSIGVDSLLTCTVDSLKERIRLVRADMQDILEYVQLLTCDTRPDVQKTICEWLNNLVGTESRLAAIHARAHNAVINLLSSSNDSVLSAAIAALSTIATWNFAELPKMSDILVDEGAVNRLTQLTTKRVFETIFEEVCHCLTVILDGASTIRQNEATKCFSIVHSLLCNHTKRYDRPVCKMLSRLTRDRIEYVQPVLDVGIVEQLIERLLRLRDDLLPDVLSILTNIADMSDAHAEIVAVHPVLAALQGILSEEMFERHRIPALRLIETFARYGCKLASIDLRHLVFRCVEDQSDDEIRQLATRVIRYMAQVNPLEVLIEGGTSLNFLLASEDKQHINLVLTIMQNVLSCSDAMRTNNFSRYVDAQRTRLIEHFMDKSVRTADVEFEDSVVNMLEDYSDAVDSCPTLLQDDGPLPHVDICHLVETLHTTCSEIVIRSINKLFVLSLINVNRLSRFVHREDMARLIIFINGDRPLIQRRSIRLVCNLVTRSATQLRRAELADFYPALIRSLKSSDVTVVRAGIRVLGNIACIGPSQREALNDDGVIQSLVGLVDSAAGRDTLAYVSLCLFRFLQWSDRFASRIGDACISTIKQLLMTNSEFVVLNAVSMMAMLTKSQDDAILERVIDSEVIERLSDIAHNPCYHEVEILKAVVVIISNVARSQKHLPMVIKHGAFFALQSLMPHATMKQYMISTALELTRTATRPLIQELIDVGWVNFFVTSMSNRKTRTEDHVQILLNMASRSPQNFVDAADSSLFTVLIDVFKNEDEPFEITKQCLRLLSLVLKVAANDRIHCDVLDELYRSPFRTRDLSKILETFKECWIDSECVTLAFEMIEDFNTGQEVYADREHDYCYDSEGVN